MLEFCPLCDKNGYKRRITLSQINLQEAVWLCESSECPWPFGYEDFTFVPRKIGGTWSSEWELQRPTTLKPSEPHQISLNELGLDTPPVTPGSGSEIIHKDSVFAENTCSATSLSLSTNGLVQTKGKHSCPKSNLDKFGHSYNSECGSIDSGSTGTRISGETAALLSVNRSIREEKTSPKFQSDFSLVEDLNFGSLDKRLSSSQRFSEACDAAEALTESVFNVVKPLKDKLSGLYDNGDCHESTVKCKKWLSDNTKGTVLGDHCYSSPESSRIGSRLQRCSTDSLSNRKQLPKVKSIMKTNVKLLGALVPSNSTYSEENNSPSLTSTMIFDDLDDKNIAEYEESTIFTMDGSLSINLSDEAPSFVEECVTIPWSTDYGDMKNERIMETDSKPEPVADNNSIVIRIKAEDLASIQGTRIVKPSMNFKTETQSEPDYKLQNENRNTQSGDEGNQTIEEPDFKPETVADSHSIISIGIKPEKLANIQENRIGESALNIITETQSKVDFKLHVEKTDTECEYVGNEKIEELDFKPEPVVDNNPVISISMEPKDVADIQGARNVQQPASSNKIETQMKSMKKPLKRMLPKTAKYQGFNFGTLKKKSKSNTSNSEEYIKYSLPNLPSPDNGSICSDVTWSSDSSYMTAATVDSKLDSNSKSSLGEDDGSLTSGSDVKSGSNAFSPEIDVVSESNLNLDLQVLDELMLCDDVDLPQGFGDDWLVSLFD